MTEPGQGRTATARAWASRVGNATRDWSLRELRSDEGANDTSAVVADGGRDVQAAARAGDGRRGRRSGRRGGADDGSREQPMVPKADFASYYGRPVLKPPAWKDDIAYYFFLGGLSAGCSLLGAGADLSGRPALRRGTRVAALGTIGLGAYYLIHDLGRPERFLNMMRVAKVTSPMSMGTWILAAYGPGVGVAALSEVLPARVRATPLGRLVELAARPAGLSSAALAPLVAAYTASLLSQTAVPAWKESAPELPFIFTASAAASAGGLGMLVAPPSQAAPARRLAIYGALVELFASRRLENRLGVVGEAFMTGQARKDLERASLLTAAGTLGGLLLGRRSRAGAALAGVTLLAGGFYERLGLLHAGVASTEDPKYVVQAQRERIAEHGPTRITD